MLWSEAVRTSIGFGAFRVDFSFFSDVEGLVESERLSEKRAKVSTKYSALRSISTVG